MYNINACPMMYQQMYNMQQMPGIKYEEKNDIMCPIHHMYYNPNMYMENQLQLEMMYYEEDEKDDMYLMDMYPQQCKKMMPCIDRVLDKMEEQDDFLYSEHPDRDMIRTMIDDAYDEVLKDMPELKYNHDDSRQYDSRALLRDLVAVLLIGQLARRRRRRRFPYYGYGYGPGYGPGYGYYGRGEDEEDFNPFDYKDFYYDLD